MKVLLGYLELAQVDSVMVNRDFFLGRIYNKGRIIDEIERNNNEEKKLNENKNGS